MPGPLINQVLFRVYYTLHGSQIIFLLAGSTKGPSKILSCFYQDLLTDFISRVSVYMVFLCYRDFSFSTFKLANIGRMAHWLTRNKID